MTAARKSARPGASSALVKVQIARKELGLDDVVYRGILLRLTGQASAAGLSDATLGLVLDEFKAKGWKPKVKAGGKASSAVDRKSPRADHPVAKKARALWISLHALGVIENPSEEALEAFSKRQTGADRLAWINQRQGTKLIDALKGMGTRAGWDQSGTTDQIKARLAALLEARRG